MTTERSNDDGDPTATGLIRQVGGRSTGSIHGNAVRSINRNNHAANPRTRAYWSHQYYLAPCVIGDKVYDFIRERLGIVRPRKDGRWDWFRRPTRAHTPWPVMDFQQGVARTLEEARAAVEAGWTLLIQPNESEVTTNGNA